MSTVSSATARGSRRYQEDRWVTAEIAGGQLLAVFDGHRGAATAEKAAGALSAHFMKSLQNLHGHVTQALRETIHELVELTRQNEAGSTASIVYIDPHDQKAYVAVLGDSPVAVVDESERLWIGPDHNVRTNPTEREAAERRGAVYTGGYVEDSLHPGTGLQMARSLGDSELDRILNREPEISTIPLGEKSIVLIGTDGLLEPLAAPLTDQIKRLMDKTRQDANAQAIVDDALERQTGDNVTAIVWKA